MSMAISGAPDTAVSDTQQIATLRALLILLAKENAEDFRQVYLNALAWVNQSPTE